MIQLLVKKEKITKPDFKVHLRDSKEIKRAIAMKDIQTAISLTKLGVSLEF